MRQRYFRVQKNKNYTVIDNRYLFNKNLSLEAKGLFTLILSRPDNFNPILSEMAKHSSNGLCSHRKAYNQLVEQGYIEKISYRLSDGKYKTDYVIYENPELNPNHKPATEPTTITKAPEIDTDNNLTLPFYETAFDLPTRLTGRGSTDAVNRTVISTKTTNTNISTRERREKREFEEIKNSPPPPPDPPDEFDLRKKRYSEIKNIIAGFFREETHSTYNDVIDDPWIYKLVDLVAEDFEQVRKKMEIWKLKKNSIDNPFWKKSQPTAFYLVKLWNELVSEPRRDNKGGYVPRNNI